MKKILFYLLFLSQFICTSQINLELDEKAPEFTITDWIINKPDNIELNGKFLVLEFWATWCAPCLKSVPHMNELQNQFKNKNIVFLSLTNEKKDKILKSLKKFNFETVVVSDTTNATFENYKSIEYNDILRPSIVLIDNYGIIKWVGYPKLLNEKIINNFLNGNLKTYNYFTTSQFKKDLKEDKGSIKDFKNKLQTVINDPNINEFIFVEKSNLEYGLNAFEDPQNKVMFLAHKDIRYLYSKLINKPINEFIIDENLAFEKFNFCMIYKSLNFENLEKIFLEKLNLKKEIILKDLDYYDLIIDYKKIGLGKNEEFKPKFVEDDENGELTYINYGINHLISDLNERFNLTLTSKNLDTKVYDFKILYNDMKDIFTSLEKYGIKILNYKKTVQIFKLEKIK